MATRKKTPKREPVRVIVEVVVRNESVTTIPFSGIIKSNVLNVHDAGGESPNFQFKFTMANGTRLSRIDIDGYVFDREKLEKASKIEDDGKLVVEVYMPAMTTPIPMIIDAVGEPFRVISFTLKYNKKDVYKDDDPQKITIGDNRRGRWEMADVNLP